MYLVVGLGNPGREYEATRHNAGFMVVDALCDELGVKLIHKKFKARWGEGKLGRHKIILAKPQTFINASGESVKLIADFFKIPASNIMVIHDDMDLSLGRVKLKEKGGSAGHKGVKSVIMSLGTNDFKRVRLGIGRPQGKRSAEVFVLSPFRKNEVEEVTFAITTAKEAVIEAIKKGFAFAMSKYNQEQRA